MVEHDDVRRLEAPLTAYAHERRITGAGADDVDTRSIHGSCRTRDSFESRACFAPARPFGIEPNSSSNSPRALRVERLGEPPAELRRDRRGPTHRTAHDADPIERRDDGQHLERRRRARWRWRRAAADTRRRAPRRALVRPRAPVPPARRAARQRRPGRLVVEADLSGNNTLTGGRNALIDRNRGAEMRSPNPSRRRPAQASTSASNPPASSLARRVSTLPRMGANVAPGEERRQLRHPPHAARADGRAPSASRASGVGHGRPGSRAVGEARSRPGHLPAAGRRRRSAPPAARPADPSRCGPPRRRRRGGARLRAP